MMMYFRFLCLVSILAVSFGCLKTRDDVDEQEQRQVMQQQVSTLQQKNADSNTRLTDMEAAIRETSGKIDVVDAKLKSRETQVSQELQLQADNQMALAKKMDLIQEEVLQLKAEIQALQGSSHAKTDAKKPISSKKTNWDEANEKYKMKDWKQSILAFQKFREDNPKSARVPEAIYKIGVSFQELGMNNEAKSFYDELIVKYPKSPDATKAKSKVKNLK